jgi:hypothetical protein
MRERCPLYLRKPTFAGLGPKWLTGDASIVDQPAHAQAGKKETKNPARKTLFCLQSNAIIFGLRVHPRVNQILEGARDFLNAIELIDARRV